MKPTIQYPCHDRPENVPAIIFPKEVPQALEGMKFRAICYISPSNWEKYGTSSLDWYPGALGPGEYYLYEAYRDSTTDWILYINTGKKAYLESISKKPVEHFREVLR